MCKTHVSLKYYSVVFSRPPCSSSIATCTIHSKTAENPCFIYLKGNFSYLESNNFPPACLNIHRKFSAFLKKINIVASGHFDPHNVGLIRTNEMPPSPSTHFVLFVLFLKTSSSPHFSNEDSVVVPSKAPPTSTTK